MCADVATVAVREIHSSEIDLLSKITVEAYTIAFAGTDVGGYIYELADVAGRVRQAEVLVAVEADRERVSVSETAGGDLRVLGGVTYVPAAVNPYAEFDDPDAAGIRMLAVDPAAQGRGVGAALVRACAQRAHDGQRRRIVLHTMEEMVAARRLYEGFGFERAPARDWRPQSHILLLGYERLLDGRENASEHT
jgi:ribosomal protein S18 acetylase RimI-like enzyme